jgi:hypothetical protein
MVTTVTVTAFMRFRRGTKKESPPLLIAILWLRGARLISWIPNGTIAQPVIVFPDGDGTLWRVNPVNIISAFQYHLCIMHIRNAATGLSS